MGPEDVSRSGREDGGVGDSDAEASSCPGGGRGSSGTTRPPLEEVGPSLPADDNGTDRCPPPASPRWLPALARSLGRRRTLSSLLSTTTTPLLYGIRVWTLELLWKLEENSVLEEIGCSEEYMDPREYSQDRGACKEEEEVVVVAAAAAAMP